MNNLLYVLKTAAVETIRDAVHRVIANNTQTHELPQNIKRSEMIRYNGYHKHIRKVFSHGMAVLSRISIRLQNIFIPEKRQVAEQPA